MLMNRVESALVRNRFRHMVQRRVESRILIGMGGALSGGTALEVGCGAGAGVEIILDVFGAASVHAFDLDPQLLQAARHRLRRRGDRIRLWRGDVTAIGAAARRYDAVFDFAAIHHVHDWNRALSEIHRVLKPGGRLYAEEVQRALVTHPLWSKILVHPQEERFDHGEFCDALRAHGFRIVAAKPVGRWFGFYVAEK